MKPHLAQDLWDVTLEGDCFVAVTGAKIVGLRRQVTLGYPRFSVIATLIISWLVSDWLSGAAGTQRMQLPENWDSATCRCGAAIGHKDHPFWTFDPLQSIPPIPFHLFPNVY